VSPETGTASRRLLANVVDGILEATVVGSFSKVGIAVRRRIGPWAQPPLLEGKLFVVTGASSGIGRAIAVGLARLGAHLVVVGRDDERLAATVRAGAATRGGGRIVSARVDLVNPEEIVSLVERVGAHETHLDGVVHCAGALFAERRTAPDGTELTLALHVLAPFRLSQLLHPLLSAAPAPVIVTVSSGGMYTQRFDLDHLELGEEDYRGATAYARAKRAQVVLAHEWARRWGPEGVASYVMHPGWVATPGLTTGLPSFARLGPLLRTPAEGADTAVWLTAGGPPRRAAPDEPAIDTKGIWLDRRRRSDCYLPTTYRRPANQLRDGAALWEWCASRAVPGRP
jgi:NAD(P)-dependent dehydrogenase (short-subunit alcohol dehydrogenase family)